MVTRKWPLPIAGSSSFRSSTAAAGSTFRSSAARAAWGRRSLCSAGRRCLELRQALRHQRPQGPLHDQVDQLLGRVETAAVLAGVGVGPDGDAAVVVAERLALQEALVDRAELLNGHVAVVDEPAMAVRLGVAQVVDDRGQLRVGEADSPPAGAQPCPWRTAHRCTAAGRWTRVAGRQSSRHRVE